MKKFLLLVGLSLVASLEIAASVQPRKNFVCKKMSSPSAMAVRAASSDDVPLPMTQKLYVYEDGEWYFTGTTSLVYNEMRKVVSETTVDVDGEYSRVINSYDALGNLTGVTNETSEDEGQTWIPSDRTEYSYDSVVTGFRTSRLQFIYDGDEWYQVYGHRYDITRDGRNAVTAVDLMSFFQGAYDCIESVKIGYSDDSEYPVSWTHYGFDYSTFDGLTADTRLDDIRWQNCDNQLLTLEDSGFLLGVNRISSAVIMDFESEASGTFNVEYTGERDFHAVITPDEQEDGETYTSVHSLVSTDSFGSFVESIYDSVSDEEGTEVAEGEKLVMVYDDHGNNIFEENLMFTTLTYDGETETYEEFMGGMSFTYDYGQQGEILVRIDSEIIVDEETGEQVIEPIIKIVSEDFTASSLASPSVEGVMPVESRWYDLQGRPVVNPSAGGIYIVATTYSNGVVKSRKVVR